MKIRNRLVVLYLALVVLTEGVAIAQQDPQGVADSIWIECVSYDGDSVLIEVRIMTDNTDSNRIMAFGLPFLISVSPPSSFVSLDTTVARTFAASVASGFAIKSARTDSTGGADPTQTPVHFVPGAVNFSFSGGFGPVNDTLLLTIKANLTGASAAIEIDTFSAPPITPSFVTESVVEYVPGWYRPWLYPGCFIQEARHVPLELNGIPPDFGLIQNYPNPFNATTIIQFAVKQTSHVKLEIFNVLGQRVNTLVDEELTAGYKQILWDGTDQKGNAVATGIYFYRIKAGNLFTEMKKMVLLK